MQSGSWWRGPFIFFYEFLFDPMVFNKILFNLQIFEFFPSFIFMVIFLTALRSKRILAMIFCFHDFMGTLFVLEHVAYPMSAYVQ